MTDLQDLADPKQIRNARVRREKLKLYVMTQVESARTRIMGKYALWERIDKIWRNYRFAKPYPWRANVFNPLSFFLIETIFPKMVLSIFQDPERIVSVQPTEKNDFEVANQADGLVNFQLLREMQATFQALKVMKSKLLFGSGVGKVTWDAKNSVPVLRQIPLQNFLHDPDDKDCQGQGWRSEYVYKSLADLRDMERQGLYHSVDFVKGTMPRDDQDRGYDAPRLLQEYDPVKNIKLLEWYGLVPMSLLMDGAGSDERIPALVNIANDQVVIRDEPNPFDHQQSPYLEDIDHLDLFDVYGMGEIEPLESLVWMANDLMNQYLDGRNLELNTMWAATRNADIDTQTLVSRPGGIILGNDITEASLRRLDWKNQTVSNIQDQNFMTQLFQMGSGVTNLSAGLQGANTPETASGTELLTSSAGTRIALKLFLTNLLFIGPLAKMVISLDKQLLPEEKSIRILGTQNFLKVLRQDLAGAKDFDVNPIPVNVMGSVQTQMRDLTNVLQVVGSIPPGNPMTQPFVDRLIKMSGLKDPRLFTSMEPAVDVLQQEMATAGQANPMGRGGAMLPKGPLTPEQVPGGTGGLR